MEIETKSSLPPFALCVGVAVAYATVKLWLTMRIKKRPLHVGSYLWIMWAAGKHFISFLLMAIITYTPQPRSVKLGLYIGAEVFLVVGHLLLMLGVEDLVVAWWEETHPSEGSTDISRAILIPATAVGVVGGILYYTLLFGTHTPEEAAAGVHVQRCRVASSVLFLLVCLGLLGSVMRARSETLAAAPGGTERRASGVSAQESERSVSPEPVSTHTWTTNLLFVLIATCTAQSIYRLWSAADPRSAAAHPEAILLAVALPELAVMGALALLDIDDLSDVRVWRAGRGSVRLQHGWV